MKRILFVMAAAAAAVLAVSCGGSEPDPVAEAIKAEITTNMAEGFTSVKNITYELVDSTTFAQEFERRIKTFEVKRDADGKYLLKYTREGKTRNAAIKSDAYKRDLEILRDLDSLHAACAGILDDVAYYDYRFSADAKGDNSVMQFRDAYVAMTPEHEVIGMTAKQKDLHKGLGKVIPGYLGLVKGEEEEEAQE